MAIVCRSCGQVNPAGSAACRRCGAGAQVTPVLGTPRPAPPSDAAALARLADEEYRPPAGQGWAFARFRQAYALDETRRYAAAPAPRTAPLPVPIAAPSPKTPKDPGTAFVLELLPAYFGFYGIGYIWAGEVGLGLALLFGNWVVWTIGGLLAFLFSLFTLGLGLLCVTPLFIALYFLGPVVSGLALQRRLKARLVLPAGGG